MLRLIALCLLATLMLVRPAAAQETGVPAAEPTPPALLVANEIRVEDRNRLVASGDVEILHDGIRLSATRIAYDQSTDTLTIEGQIRITDPNGTIVMADAAELDQGLRNGILSGARLVLDQQLQLASVEARRVDGRYTQMSRVAATACQVCGRNQVPLWQIRAARVVHDQLERQLYFDEAQLRVLDVPVFYVPRLRLPDPTLERARGFLIPSIRSSSLLGLGVKIPYFIPIGDHQDVTLTPYLSPKTRTLEFRYRRAFHNGDLQLNGAVSSDTLRRDTLRGYLFASGDFGLRNDIRLTFDLKSVLDEAYLNDYGYGGGDRLASKIEATRVKRDSFARAELIHYQSLRAEEDDDTQPSIIAGLSGEKRLFPKALGGELRLSAEAHSHYRYSSFAFDGTDADSDVDGRDVAQLNAEVSWRNRWTLPGGLRLGASAHLWLDRYSTRQDASADADVSRATPGASVDLRWPLMRQGPQGGRTLIEPVMQFGWVGGTRPGNPNDESTRVEFDEANLLSLSRFPAEDRRQHGLMGAAGLRWSHQAATGWQASMTVGRVWQENADVDFSRSSGLDSDTSDWLISGHFTNPLGLSLSARGLLDDSARFSKAEARADWTSDRLDLGASYVLLVTDADESRTKAQSEWTFDGSYRFAQNWTTSTEWRYDLADQRLDRVGLGLQYRNECVQVDFGATRRYARSANIEPTTDFDLTVALKGFSTGGSGKEYRRTCN